MSNPFTRREFLATTALGGAAATAYGTALLTASSSSVAYAQSSVTPAEARAIAKEAYIYGYPMVDGYRVQYSYFVDRQNP